MLLNFVCDCHVIHNTSNMSILRGITSEEGGAKLSK